MVHFFLKVVGCPVLSCKWFVGFGCVYMKGQNSLLYFRLGNEKNNGCLHEMVGCP
ncbi:hypothetical protein Scep_004090 [Stephania cephalantha]|uniref:Uncharacterized protein n=1 Tax=Stephania cephalantha TaxID=152367 RepID=A0AAP0KRW5_9MAGN